MTQSIKRKLAKFFAWLATVFLLIAIAAFLTMITAFGLDKTYIAGGAALFFVSCMVLAFAFLIITDNL